MSQDPLAGRVLGSFRLVQCIGHGGMGMVYEAVHMQLQVSYAIKILHPTLTRDELMVARLKREATVALQMQHEHIVQVLDYGWDDELGFYLIMEMLRGEDLGCLLKREPILSIRRMASIVYQTCSALELAHSRGVIHRDLKPGNVFLTPTADGNDFVKLLDFGIARVLNPAAGNQTQLTRAGKSFGTPEYMPPEQIRAQRDKVGPATDIYGLCIVIFKMLTGILPFRSSNLIELMNQVMLQTPPMLSRFRQDLAGTSLERLVFVCLAKNPANRVQPMAEFFAQFREACEQDPRLAEAIDAEDRALRDLKTVYDAPDQTNELNAEEELFGTTDGTELLARDHHGFAPGQAFVFAGETYSFDGQKLRSATGEISGHWSHTSETTTGVTSDVSLDTFMQHDAAALAQGMLQHMHALGEATTILPSAPRLPPPAGHMFDQEETLKASPEEFAAILNGALVEDVLGKLPTLPGQNDLTVAPKMVHRRPGTPMPALPAPFAGADMRKLQRDDEEGGEASLQARIIRLSVGFFIGFIVIAMGMWFFRQEPPVEQDCCTLVIRSMPEQARVIEQGRLLGMTPLRLRRARGQLLQFALVKQGYELVAGSWKAQRNHKMRFSLRVRKETNQR